jgi:CrcB protein
MIYLWVFLGGALGGMARYWVSGAVAKLIGKTFPWGTVIINISGSFLVVFFGTVAAEQGSLPESPDLRTFVMVGFCGGYTTVSSFALQTLSLVRNNEWRGAAANILVSIVFCVAAAWLGYLVGVGVGNVGTG